MGQLIGTLSYTAPEEILAIEPRDHLVDVYSLGCVLYEAITARRRSFASATSSSSTRMSATPVRARPRARSDLPAGIDEVIATAMAISRRERYSSCRELVAAARALLGEEQEARVADEAPGPSAPPLCPRSRHRAERTQRRPGTSEPVPEERRRAGRCAPARRPRPPRPRARSHRRRRARDSAG